MYNMKGKIYGFIDDLDNPCSSSTFQKRISPILEDILEDPYANIILSDLTQGGMFVAKFLKQRYYRNATLYHIGENPRINIAKLKTKGGFTSKEDCIFNMSKECHEKISLSNNLV